MQQLDLAEQKRTAAPVITATSTIEPAEKPKAPTITPLMQHIIAKHEQASKAARSNTSGRSTTRARDSHGVPLPQATSGAAAQAARKAAHSATADSSGRDKDSTKRGASAKSVDSSNNSKAKAAKGASATAQAEAPATSKKAAAQAQQAKRKGTGKQEVGQSPLRASSASRPTQPTIASSPLQNGSEAVSKSEQQMSAMKRAQMAAAKAAAEFAISKASMSPPSQANATKVRFSWCACISLHTSMCLCTEKNAPLTTCLQGYILMVRCKPRGIRLHSSHHLSCLPMNVPVRCRTHLEARIMSRHMACLTAQLRHQESHLHKQQQMQQPVAHHHASCSGQSSPPTAPPQAARPTAQQPQHLLTARRRLQLQLHHRKRSSKLTARAPSRQAVPMAASAAHQTPALAEGSAAEGVVGSAKARRQQMAASRCVAASVIIYSVCCLYIAHSRHSVSDSLLSKRRHSVSDALLSIVGQMW